MTSRDRRDLTKEFAAGGICGKIYEWPPKSLMKSILVLQNVLSFNNMHGRLRRSRVCHINGHARK